jgi:hypothetical protein
VFDLELGVADFGAAGTLLAQSLIRPPSESFLVVLETTQFIKKRVDSLSENIVLMKCVLDSQQRCLVAFLIIQGMCIRINVISLTGILDGFLQQCFCCLLFLFLPTNNFSFSVTQ